jgi:hypothetical protein
MPDGAAAAPAVRAARLGSGRVADLHPPVADPCRVDGTEGGRGEGDQQPRMRGHGVGEALAADKPSPEQLVGVGAVDLGAGLAAGGPPGAARLQQHPVGQLGAVKDAHRLAGGLVDLAGAVDQANRPLAEAGRADLRAPAVQAGGVAGPLAQLADQRRVQARRR